MAMRVPGRTVSTGELVVVDIVMSGRLSGAATGVPSLDEHEDSDSTTRVAAAAAAVAVRVRKIVIPQC
jgi:hypothetical protein